MITIVIIAAVVILTVGGAVRRMMDLHRMPLLAWPVLLVASVIPGIVAYLVLNPGAPVSQVTVQALKDEVRLEVPEGHALMVTATLAPMEDQGDKTVSLNTTAYNLSVSGEGWAQSASGTIRRKNAGTGADIDAFGGSGISESGRKRTGTFGENLQDRFDLEGTGTVDVRVTNWAGRAAQTLQLEVVRGPPSGMAVLAIVGVLTILGLVLEVHYGIERVAGDIAFLGFWGYFLREGVTPLDDWQRVGWAVAPAALMGWLVVGGLGWLILKYQETKEAAEDAGQKAAEAAAAAAAEEAARPGRRRKR